MNEEAPVLQARGLTRSFGSGEVKTTAVNDVSLDLYPGQVALFMGPSGSGKSTLLGLLAGLDTPSGGEIRMNGEVLTRMNEDQLARFRGRTLGFVFQSFQLIPSLTAQENVQVPLEIRGLPGAAQRAATLLAEVGLAERGHHYPPQLSGGEQQRVAIARAFACRPPVLLADEPTGNLDSVTGALILDLLVALHRDSGATLVLVTHDEAIARAAQRILRLKDGAIVADSMPSADGRDAAPAATEAPAPGTALGDVAASRAHS
jgi:putative ABC transport system ATP-binding protein